MTTASAPRLANKLMWVDLKAETGLAIAKARPALHLQSDSASWSLARSARRGARAY